MIRFFHSHHFTTILFKVTNSILGINSITKKLGFDFFFSTAILILVQLIPVQTLKFRGKTFSRVRSGMLHDLQFLYSKNF